MTVKEATRRVHIGRWTFALGVVVAAAVVMSVSLTGGGRRARSFSGSVANGGQPPSSEVSAAESSRVGDQLLDARRELDLGELHDAMESYAEFLGKYPSTNGALTTFCSRWTDPGCDVITHGRALPASDGFVPYWYASDGATYTLVAHMRLWPPTNDCPVALRPDIGNVPALCINGAIGNP